MEWFVHLLPSVFNLGHALDLKEVSPLSFHVVKVFKIPVLGSWAGPRGVE